MIVWQAVTRRKKRPNPPSGTETPPSEDPAEGAHLRRIIGEAAWSYQYRPAMSADMKKRQEGLSEEVKEMAWKAQTRLCTRYRRLLAKGKLRQKVATAIGRALLGFIWAIGVEVAKESAPAA